MTGMPGTYRLQKAWGKRDLEIAYAFNLQETNLIFWISNANPTNSTWKHEWIGYLKTQNLTYHKGTSANYFCFHYQGFVPTATLVCKYIVSSIYHIELIKLPFFLHYVRVFSIFISKTIHYLSLLFTFLILWVGINFSKLHYFTACLFWTTLLENTFSPALQIPCNLLNMANLCVLPGVYYTRIFFLLIYFLITVSVKSIGVCITRQVKDTTVSCHGSFLLKKP